MKHQNNWQQIVTKTVLLALSLPICLTSAAMANTIANTVELNSPRFQTQENLPELQPGLQIAQSINICRQVIAEHGLYVREEPTVYSKALGVLNFRQNVTIVPGDTENWIPISAPIRGYVWANWLTPC